MDLNLNVRTTSLSAEHSIHLLEVGATSAPIQSDAAALVAGYAEKAANVSGDADQLARQAQVLQQPTVQVTAETADEVIQMLMAASNNGTAPISDDMADQAVSILTTSAADTDAAGLTSATSTAPTFYIPIMDASMDTVVLLIKALLEMRKTSIETGTKLTKLSYDQSLAQAEQTRKSGRDQLMGTAIGGGIGALGALGGATGVIGGNKQKLKAQDALDAWKGHEKTGTKLTDTLKGVEKTNAAELSKFMADNPGFNASTTPPANTPNLKLHNPLTLSKDLNLSAGTELPEGIIVDTNKAPIGAPVKEHLAIGAAGGSASMPTSKLAAWTVPAEGATLQAGSIIPAGKLSPQFASQLPDNKVTPPVTKVKTDYDAMIARHKTDLDAAAQAVADHDNYGQVMGSANVPVRLADGSLHNVLTSAKNNNHPAKLFGSDYSTKDKSSEMLMNAIRTDTYSSLMQHEGGNFIRTTGEGIGGLEAQKDRGNAEQLGAEAGVSNAMRQTKEQEVNADTSMSDYLLNLMRQVREGKESVSMRAGTLVKS